MILCYLPPNISDEEKQKRIDFLVDKYMMFFIDESDVITSTETNGKTLRFLLKKFHIKLFWINSLEELPFSPTQLSELILYCISNGIDFHSEKDGLYFTNGDIELVYPKIFEVFRNQQKRDYIPY